MRIFCFFVFLFLPSQAFANAECPFDNVRGVRKQLERAARSLPKASALPNAQTPPARLRADGLSHRIYAPEAQDLVRRIATKLLNDNDQPIPVPSIHILAAGYEAYAYFDDGLAFGHDVLSVAENDDELAFIIAHEMAHIINGDTSDNASLHRSIQRMAQLHRGLETASQLSKLRVSKDYVVSEVTEEHEISIRALNASDRLQSISSTIAKPVWRNEQEEAADGLAVRMMLKAGFRPSGAIAAFKSFAEGREKACAELVAVNETVDDVIAAARDYGVATLLTGQSVSLQDVLDPLEKRANRRLRVAFMAAALPSVYASPAEREELVRDFLSTDEGKALLSESRTNRASDQGTLAYRDSAAHAAVTASLEASYEVERALSSSHVDEAKASLSKVNMQSSHGRLLKRRVRRMQGQFDTGSDNLVLALNLSRSAKPYGEPPAVEVFELRAYDLLSAGLKEDAAALVARGAEQFADEKHFLPEHIFLAAVDDDATNLGDLEMSCTSAPRSDLWPICEAAATGFRPDFRLSAEEILTLSGAKSGQRPADRIKDGINILQRTIIQQ